MDSKLPPEEMEKSELRLVELLDELRRLLSSRQADVKAKWNRGLPFADYIVDRWQRAKDLGFGAGTSIYDSALVLGSITVGENTFIGPSTVLDGTGNLKIGSNCSISAGVQIYSHDSVMWAVSGGIEKLEYKATTIGSNCYLGPCVVVAKGVVIGDGCIIGAHSLVLEDIPAGSKAFGTPCKVVGKAPSLPLLDKAS